MRTIKSLFQGVKPLRDLYRRWYRATHPLPPVFDWETVLRASGEVWTTAHRIDGKRPRVLIATVTGGHPYASLTESVLAVALTLRGAEVHVLLCDHALPACLMAIYHPEKHADFVAQGPQRHLCAGCFAPGAALYRPLGLSIKRYSQHLTPLQRQQARQTAAQLPLEEIMTYRHDGLAIGEHVLAGALRYFARGDLQTEPDREAVVRRYFEAALLTTDVLKSLWQMQDYDAICCHHGIYVPHGIIGEFARQQGTRIVNWMASYRQQTFIFSHHDTYHHTLMDESVTTWENIDWTPNREQQVMDYLKSRWQGTQDWIYFHEKPRENWQYIVTELGIDPAKPMIGMLTNVVWDAQLHYPANAFPSMLDWLSRTVTYFASRPDLQLVIRVHPAEVRGAIPSRQRVVDELAQLFPQLPPNVFVIPPESDISTYTVCLACDSVLIYGTKTGVELTSFGVPIIVGGEAWIRNKGLTRDARNTNHYFELLDSLPLNAPMADSQIQRARRYAYHFFFRRMIPLEFVQPAPKNLYTLGITTLHELLPGKSPGLDTLCAGILTGAPFVFDMHEIAVQSAPQP